MKKVIRFSASKFLAEKQKDKAVLIAVVGDRQNGKSTLAITLGINIQSILLKEGLVKEPFSLSQMVFKAKEFDELIDKYGNFYPLIFDETILTCKSRGFWDKFSLILADRLEFCGYKHQLLILTLPKLKRLHPEVQDYVNYVIEVNKRGKAEFWEARGDGFCFVSRFGFDKLPKGIWGRYMKLKKSNIGIRREREEVKKEKKKTKTEIVLEELKKGKKPREIHKEKGISYSLISQVKKNLNNI
jgi:hypothetical protein